MCKRYQVTIAILVLVIATMTYKFVFLGSASVGDDGRQVIVLESAERNVVLAEMRDFLKSIQLITQHTVDGNMEQVAVAAKKVGAAAQQSVPGSLMGKLPLSFKHLGFNTHQQFDTLALDAESLGDPQQTMQSQSTLMQNCIGCHAAYRIDPAQK